MFSYFFIWWSHFIPSRNLDEVFTYNHVWLGRGSNSRPIGHPNSIILVCLTHSPTEPYSQFIYVCVCEFVCIYVRMCICACVYSCYRIRVVLNCIIGIV